MHDFGSKNDSLIINNFKSIFDVSWSSQIIGLYLAPNSPWELSLDAECIHKSMDHFKCTTEQFASLMTLEHNDLIELLSYPHLLSKSVCKKAGHATVLLTLGIDAFGSLEDFLIWMNTPNEIFSNKKPIDSLNEVELYWEDDIDEKPSNEDCWESDANYIELIEILTQQ